MKHTGEGEYSGLGHVAADLAGLAPDPAALGHANRQHNILLALDRRLAGSPELLIVGARLRHFPPPC